VLLCSVYTVVQNSLVDDDENSGLKSIEKVAFLDRKI